MPNSEDENRSPDLSSQSIQRLLGKPGSLRRSMWKRSSLLVVTLVSLYLVWPSLVATFSAWPGLFEVHREWLALMLVAEGASFMCIWALQRLSLGVQDFFAVATSHLAGNAVGRIVPAGAAAGPVLQFRMLQDASIPSAKVARGLATSSFIGTSTLLLLPMLTIPAALLGSPFPRGLTQTLILGTAVFLVLVGVGAMLLIWDRPLMAMGRALQSLRQHLPHERGRQVDISAELFRERNDLRRTLGSMWWKGLLLAAGNSLFDYLAILAALAAVGTSPRPALILLAYVAARILSLIPVTPGGLGFVETGLTGMLVLSGLSTADAVLATLAYRLASFWLPLPAGLVAFALHRRRYRSTRDRGPIST